jgi:GT2 family glycosyltransferase
MDLSIIIVNWNSKDYLRKCIASIQAWTSGIEYEIVVIDNASFDGCGEMLRQHYPQVRFIQSEKNVGFAKANNAAFRESSGQYILFLNPDTELISPAVNIMFDYLQNMPNAGVVGCKLLNADRSIQTSGIQAFPTILNQLLDSEVLRGLWPRLSLWGNAALFATPNGPVEVEALSGACIMLKRNVFERAGLFCEDYFMYAEDIDLCYKVSRGGCKNFYIPNALVIHFGGGSTMKATDDFTANLMRESIWRFLRKSRGETYGLGYRASTLISAMGRIACLVVFLPLHIIRRGGDAWNASFRKWRAIMVWSLGLKNRVEDLL